MAQIQLGYTEAQINNVLGNALLKNEAQNTYLSITNANTNFLTKNDAASTYLSLNNVSDYIIEEGTATGTVNGTGQDMTWTYIKWNSGLAMCHGIATTTRTGSGWNNIYYSSGSDPYWTFPSGLFISVPTLTASVQDGPDDSPKWYWVGLGGSTTKDRTCQMLIVSGGNYSNKTIKIGMIAWGRWKN